MKSIISASASPPQCMQRTRKRFAWLTAAGTVSAETLLQQTKSQYQRFRSGNSMLLNLISKIQQGLRI
jgi:hypothetical protein